MVPAVTELCYPHPAHSWTRRLAIYPRLRPPQRGQTKPFGQRCAVRCSPHRTSSPKRERNSLTVMMDFRFNGLDFFISDILSPFVRLFKLDIHQNILGRIGCPGLYKARKRLFVSNMCNLLERIVAYSYLGITSALSVNHSRSRASTNGACIPHRAERHERRVN